MAHASSDIQNRKKAILEDIDRYCKRYGYGERETVLMVGRTGVGKSAVINTIAKPVNGEYFQIASMGEGDTLSKTKQLLTYRNCGARTDMLRRHTDEFEDEVFERIKPHLPHLIDFAGLGNVDTPSLKEMFDLLLDGRIPPGTPIQVLERDQERYGIGCLSTIYDTPHPEWKVTKIVFVHSCLTSVPTALIKCLLSTLSSVEEGTNVMKFSGDVFLLITKYDLVDSNVNRTPAVSEAPESEGQSQSQTRTSQNEAETVYERGSGNSQEERRFVSLEDFERIEKTLARQLIIKGALEHNRLRWTSYGTDTGYDNENIDEIALKFMRQMVMPAAQDRWVPPDTPWITRIRLEARRGLEIAIKSVNFSKRDAVFFIMVAVLMLIIAFLLAKKA